MSMASVLRKSSYIWKDIASSVTKGLMIEHEAGKASSKKLNAKEHGDIFFCYALLRRSDEKKDISMLSKRFLSPITLKRSAGVIC